MLKKILKTIFTLAVLATFVYVFYSNFGNVWAQLYDKYFPCQGTIAYNLGTFDTQFGLSKAQFLEDMTEAEAIWENPKTGAGRQFFTYEPDNTSARVLKVNLVYDYRQEDTQKINNLGLAVSDTQASYDTLKAKYQAMQNDYQTEKAEYETAVNNFKNNQNHQASLSNIRAMEADLNKKVDDINALVTVINNLAKILNINAAELNNIGQSRGEEFTEGEYVENDSGQEINVYEFSTKERLVRLLAHELGHALGLEHVSNSNGIMYYLNQNTTGVLTPADLAELKTVCKIK